MDTAEMFNTHERYDITGYNETLNASEILCTAWARGLADAVARSFAKQQANGHELLSRTNGQPFSRFSVCDKFGKQLSTYPAPAEEKEIRLYIAKGDIVKAYRILENSGIPSWYDHGKLLIYVRDLDNAIDTLAKHGFEAEPCVMPS